MNRNGQVLPIFIIILPILLMMGALIVDKGITFNEKNRMDGLAKNVITYGLNNFSHKNIKEEMDDLIEINDQEVVKEVTILDEGIKIVMTKKTNSFFGKIMGINYYDIKSSYIGYLKNNQIVIKEAE